MAITVGTSWYAPIDFGITEKLSSFLGTPVGAYNPAQHAPTIGPETVQNYPRTILAPSGREVQGPLTRTQAIASGDILGTSDSSDTGGSGSGSGTGTNPPTPTPIDPILEEANRLYNSILGLANTAESNIRTQQPQVESNINTAAANSKSVADTQYSRSNQQINEADASAGIRKRNAMADARQALSETMIGGNQRFGRGSDIARALGEYANVGFQKAGSSIIDTYEGVKNKILQAKTNLEQDYTNTIKSIDQWRAEQLTAAQQEFQNQLLSVQSMKTDAEGARTNTRIQALQDLSARIDNINLMAWQYAKNAEANTQSKYQSWVDLINQNFPGLANQAVGADQALGSTISNTNLNPLAASSPNQAMANNYLGRISSKKDELYP